MEERTLYAGMDLRENKIQMCAYPPGSSEIKMVLEDFPFMIAIEEDKKEWLYGERALEKKEKKEEVVVFDFLKLLEGESEISVFGVRFPVEDLVSKVLKKALLSLKKEFPNDLIKILTVTTEDISPKVTKGLERAFLKLGIDRDRLRTESHGRSFLCYVLSRKRELWGGETGLLDGSNKKFIFRKISLDRRKKPMVAGVTKKLVEKENLEEAAGREIGTLYLTGSGFMGEENLEMVHRLCRGRRGFLGENLYCQGACVSSRWQEEAELMEPFVFLEEDSIPCDIYVSVYHDAKECRAVLSRASEKWYEAGESVCLILDEEEEIPVKVYHVLSGEEKVYILPLEGLWRRQPRMTKVLIKTMFPNRDTCIITVKDLGFGEFCVSSQRIWEKTIVL